MYNYNLMTTQYLNDANNQLRGIDVDVAYLLQQDFSTASRKILLDDIDGRLKSIQGDIEKVKEIDRSARAQETIAKLENNLTMVQGKVKETAALGTTNDDKVKAFANLSKTSSIASNLAVLTPDNVMQGKDLFAENIKNYDRTIKIFMVIILVGLLLGIAAAVGFLIGVMINRR